ncbi:hypothetical protein F5X96DRAFT_675092 [Biscogniauxia mediterranea]|nr:hypothetical protein F5X96DRAFT_675092 [Biscogniauxia mediterranea]
MAADSPSPAILDTLRQNEAFHTGRDKMVGFFIADALRDAGLEFERIWEHNRDGVECAWVEDRDIEGVSRRKR